MKASRTYHGRVIPESFTLDKGMRQVSITVALPLRDAGPILDLLTAAADQRLPVALAFGPAAVALQTCLAPAEDEVRRG